MHDEDWREFLRLDIEHAQAHRAAMEDMCRVQGERISYNNELMERITRALEDIAANARGLK
jgi:hypothetical protein